jgi:hypothetical protein
MNEFQTVLLVLFAYLQGVVIGYIIWAPQSTFKKSFVDGISLKIIWGRFVK